ncbi:MAG: NAD(P)/FAD-dependent oxidoreductase [Novosphingobium sp.]|nr:NAD(P)/FAD-dependent oxidoreductase [Novosphingobium sp.]
MASRAIKTDPEVVAEAEAIFVRWLDGFGVSLDAGQGEAIAAHFLADGYWKDFLALTWDFRTFAGQGEIAGELAPMIARSGIRSLHIAEGRPAPRLCKRSGRLVVEAFFNYETCIGNGTGVVRLAQDEAGEWKAWLLLTTLQELRGFEERIGAHRPTGEEFSKYLVKENWLDRRNAEQERAGDQPPVLIVGAGHAGLILAARLKSMGLDPLIIEKDARIGDVWRKRYHSLTLHNQVFANHMPYLPFPVTWPVWLPKDKLANWLETYADALELNVWTSTELTAAEYDEASKSWRAQVKRADGSVQRIVCRNLVISTGVSGSIPKKPRLPGLENFAGEVLHSSEYTRGESYAGKSVLVVGTGNSGHDIAQDLHVNGAAKVHLLQRSPTCVVSLEPTAIRTYSVYSEDTPVEDVDLLTSVIPYPILEETYKWITSKSKVVDEELIEALQSVGFRTFNGDDDTGFHMMYLRGEGGYYINVGCSDLIIEKAIDVVDYSNMNGFSAQAIELADGTSLPCDAVILATGFENMQENVRKLLGDDIADAVGPIWGLDQHCHMRNMWKPTVQPGLWIMGGALIDARLFSRFLAIQLVADVHGITPSAGN